MIPRGLRPYLIGAGATSAAAVVGPADGEFAGDHRIADGVGWTLTALFVVLVAVRVQRGRNRESISA